MKETRKLVRRQKGNGMSNQDIITLIEEFHVCVRHMLTSLFMLLSFKDSIRKITVATCRHCDSFNMGDITVLNYLNYTKTV